MSPTKHTPGPWEANTGLTVQFNRLADSIAMQCGDGSDLQQAQNYHILRAAPQLLEALERLVQVSDQPCGAGSAHPAWRIAREAITAAKGGT